MKLTIAMTMLVGLVACGGGEQPEYGNGDGAILFFGETSNWDGTGRLAWVKLMLTHPDHPHCGSLPVLGSACDDGAEDEPISLLSAECDNGCTVKISNGVLELAYTKANRSRLKVRVRDESGRQWFDSHLLPIP